MIRTVAACLVILIMTMTSCNNTKETKFSDIPALTLMQVNTETINFQDTSSMLSVVLQLTDGDGNIATRSADEDTSIGLLFFDYSSDTLNAKYRLPLPQVRSSDFQKNGGLNATMKIDLPYFYFTPIIAPGSPIRFFDTLKVAIFVQDYDANSSDTIFLQPIYVEP